MVLIGAEVHLGKCSNINMAVSMVGSGSNSQGWGQSEVELEASSTEQQGPKAVLSREGGWMACLCPRGPGLSPSWGPTWSSQQKCHTYFEAMQSSQSGSGLHASSEAEVWSGQDHTCAF